MGGGGGRGREVAPNLKYTQCHHRRDSALRWAATGVSPSLLFHKLWGGEGYYKTVMMMMMIAFI